MLVCSCKNTNKNRNEEENSRKIRNIFYLITRRAGTHYMYQPFLIHYYIYIYYIHITHPYLVSENLMLKPKSCVVVG